MRYLVGILYAAACASFRRGGGRVVGNVGISRLVLFEPHTPAVLIHKSIVDLKPPQNSQIEGEAKRTRGENVR